MRLPETPVIRQLDPAAVNRVLGNILTNALKYSAGDLEVTLEESGRLTFSNSAPGLDPVAAGATVRPVLHRGGGAELHGAGAFHRQGTDPAHGRLHWRGASRRHADCVVEALAALFSLRNQPSQSHKQRGLLP